jgi:hypothetical protein
VASEPMNIRMRDGPLLGVRFAFATAAAPVEAGALGAIRFI